jgi:hypothetical protein
MVGPAIVRIGGAVIVGPVITTVDVTIAATPDLLDCSNTKLD